MQLQLTNEEKVMFDGLAHSHHGTVLQEYVERMIKTIESVRTNTTLSNEARIEVANTLEVNIVERLKQYRGETHDQEDQDEML